MDLRNEKIENYEKFCKLIMEKLKNPWIPCPQYQYVDEDEKIEKILEEIPINVLIVNIDGCSYDKNDAYITLSLRKNIF